MREFKLMVDVPYLKKGTRFIMDDVTSDVFFITDNGELSRYALRSSLAGYLWLLATDRKYMRYIGVR